MWPFGKRNRKDRWTDPEWLAAYIKKLEFDMDDRRLVEKELAWMASISERDPNCSVEIAASGELGYINPSAHAAFPDLVEKGKKHPIFAGMDELHDLMIKEGKLNMRRPVRVGDRVFEEQITWNTETNKYLFYLTDVTQWKRLDQLKTDLLNTVSHEFRTPLASLMASLRMVDQRVLGPVTDDQHQALETALHSVERLNRLITNLLDVSKMEAGRFELQRDEIDVAALAQSVFKTIEPLAKERNIELRVRIPSEPVELLADGDKLIQVLTNLLSNAFKFTEKGWISLSLEPREQEVICSVADSGRGIPAEKLPHVFGKFQQFGPSVTGEKGTGLGLSLCKNLIELHQGQIKVESVFGEGTTFSFTLPRMSAKAVFDNALQRLYEQAVVNGRVISAFILQLEEAGQLAVSAHSKEFVAKLDALVRKRVRSERDVVIRGGSTLYFILEGVTRARAKELMEQMVEEFAQIVQKSGAPENLALRVQHTSLPEDTTVFEGLRSRLGGS